MKVIIAGSRDVTDYFVVKAACEESGFEFTEVVSGKAPGADSLGEWYANEIDVPIAEFPADWKNLDAPGAIVKRNKHGAYNAAAGFARNKKMAEYGDALVAIWIGGSRGTKNMIELARKAGLSIFVQKFVRVDYELKEDGVICES